MYFNFSPFRLKRFQFFPLTIYVYFEELPLRFMYSAKNRPYDLCIRRRTALTIYVFGEEPHLRFVYSALNCSYVFCVSCQAQDPCCVSCQTDDPHEVRGRGSLVRKVRQESESWFAIELEGQAKHLQTHEQAAKTENQKPRTEI